MYSSRDPHEDTREDFYLYIDECHNLAPYILASILSEARKYRLNLTIAHQYLAQLPEEVRASILGNAGSIIAFRLGSTDAIALAEEFAPDLNVQDLENLGPYQIYTKLLVDGLTSRPFSAQTLPPVARNKDEGNKESIIKLSRQNYGTPRLTIEGKINKWLGV